MAPGMLGGVNIQARVVGHSCSVSFTCRANYPVEQLTPIQWKKLKSLCRAVLVLLLQLGRHRAWEGGSEAEAQEKLV